MNAPKLSLVTSQLSLVTSQLSLITSQLNLMTSPLALVTSRATRKLHSSLWWFRSSLWLLHCSLSSLHCFYENFTAPMAGFRLTLGTFVRPLKVEYGCFFVVAKETTVAVVALLLFSGTSHLLSCLQ